MEININNVLHLVPDASTLDELVFSQIGVIQNGIAVALNQQVIPKLQWQKTAICPGDRILIIKATQGG